MISSTAAFDRDSGATHSKDTSVLFQETQGCALRFSWLTRERSRCFAEEYPEVLKLSGSYRVIA